jgi:hypothetical protein
MSVSITMFALMKTETCTFPKLGGSAEHEGLVPHYQDDACYRSTLMIKSD